MFGVILAGGSGTRLKPLTNAVNKALLPIGKFPMIYHSIMKFTKIGIKKIVIITGRESAGDIIDLLGSGSELGVSLYYVVQDTPSGIPSAIALTKDIVKEESFIVLLSDNIFEDDLPNDLHPTGCTIFLKEVEDPQRFGVAKFEGDKIVDLIEKPEAPPSEMAVVGIYKLDRYFWDIFPTLKPSARHETEITDVLKRYLLWEGGLKYKILKGHWADVGTITSYYKVNKYLMEKES